MILRRTQRRPCALVRHSKPDEQPGSTGEAAPPVRNPLLRLVLPTAVILLILGGATLLLVGGSSKPALPGNAGVAKAAQLRWLGPVATAGRAGAVLDSLRNYDGSSFSLAAQRGKAVFVTFLYAHCPDVCP